MCEFKGNQIQINIYILLIYSKILYFFIYKQRKLKKKAIEPENINFKLTDFIFYL